MMDASRVLRLYEGRGGASLQTLGASLALRVVRDGVAIRVTVASEPVEWYVDVEELSTRTRVHDWCDYLGYDDTPIAELERDMATEVLEFVDGLFLRKLRFVRRGRRGKSRLEWLVDGRWTQAVPFILQTDAR